MKRYQDILEDIPVDTNLAESVVVYSVGERNPFIDPLVDWAFKRIFASEANKEVARAFLNEVLKGKREIVSIAYGKNEYPGEIKDKRGAVLDFVCVDENGISFLVELQRTQQTHFKDRSLFYASRLISDQAPKGKKWNYELKPVYVISLLEEFCLPGTDKGLYLHDVALFDTRKATVFYDKLHFVYIELKKFDKSESELKTGLDKWIYSLKNASTMTKEPAFAEEMRVFFESARCAKFTKEELEMYRTAQQEEWDNQNVLDFAMEKGKEQGLEAGLEQGLKQGALSKALEIAKNLRDRGLSIAEVTEVTRLSKEQIQAL
ncbi:Rpn family recombination-promoting nuclease/putative transposase [Pedobacter sp. GR22-6]|uniref:Rpn family recombination-promoting nuclease/putative transposase n=1 Tax=Pedobacter sp. GR22-6 TaxID=3127957 RepID=UPI00307F4191